MQIAPITSAGAAQSAAPSPIASGLQAVIARDYSTTAGGKTYGAYVEQGQYGYEASVANVPGANASGSTVEAVEYDLGNLISFFV
jgi:hypothetical protein